MIKEAALYGITFLAILIAIWLAFTVAGTGYTIPYGIVICATGVLLARKV